jgi:hypothetical protein
MNPANQLTDDAIKLAEALATAYVSGSASAMFDSVSATVLGKTFSLTPSVSITVK